MFDLAKHWQVSVSCTPSPIVRLPRPTSSSSSPHFASLHVTCSAARAEAHPVARAREAPRGDGLRALEGPIDPQSPAGEAVGTCARARCGTGGVAPPAGHIAKALDGRPSRACDDHARDRVSLSSRSKTRRSVKARRSHGIDPSSRRLGARDHGTAGPAEHAVARDMGHPNYKSSAVTSCSTAGSRSCPVDARARAGVFSRPVPSAIPACLCEFLRTASTRAARHRARARRDQKDDMPSRSSALLARRLSAGVDDSFITPP